MTNLLGALEKHYGPDLVRTSPSWSFQLDGPSKPAVDVAQVVGLPGMVLSAMLAGRCRDQKIPATMEHQKNFAELMRRQCSSVWFTLVDAGVGPECCKAIIIALALNERFASLCLRFNKLRDEGANSIAKLLPEHRALVHIDISSCGISPIGAKAIFDSLLHNRSVTHLNISSGKGGMRNYVNEQCNASLECMLLRNPVLATLQLSYVNLQCGTLAAIARGLACNSTLTKLDLSMNDLHSESIIAVAEILGPHCGLEDLNLSDNPNLGDDSLWALARCMAAKSIQREVSKISLHRLLDVDVRSLNKIDGRSKTRKTSPKGFPRIQALRLANVGATPMGVGFFADSLEVNNILETLVLDGAVSTRMGAGSPFLQSLSGNCSLTNLSLRGCLGSGGVQELAKALCLSPQCSLRVLDLRECRFDEEGAGALGSALSRAVALKLLDVSACELVDAGGAILCSELLQGSSKLEVLRMRDNMLQERTGYAIVDGLRVCTSVQDVDLELNIISFRCNSLIRQLLDSNANTRFYRRTERYRERIAFLKVCAQKVAIMDEESKTRQVVVNDSKATQAAVIEDFEKMKMECKERCLALEAQLVAVGEESVFVDTEVEATTAALRALCEREEAEVAALREKIATVDEYVAAEEELIRQLQAERASYQQHAFATMQRRTEEREVAEAAQQRAAALRNATRRNCDSFVVSLRAIEDCIAGGSDPRSRVKEWKRSVLMEAVAPLPSIAGCSRGAGPGSARGSVLSARRGMWR